MNKNDQWRELSLTPRPTLECMTVHDLRKMVSGLIPNKNKLRKGELIDAIIEGGEIFRIQAKNELKETMQYMGDFIVNEAFFKYLYDKGTSPEKTAKITYQKLKSQRYSPNYLAKDCMARVREYLKLGECPPEWADKVYTQLRMLIVEISKEVNKNYRNKVEKYGTEEGLAIRIDGKQVMEWIDRTLQGKPTWHRVSFILALTSGRRRVEIHGDRTKYEYVDEETIKATGLAKKEGDSELLFRPLIPASTWMELFEGLPPERKGLTPKAVEGGLRKLIEQNLKPALKELGFRSYKDSRDFYINYCIKHFFDRSQDFNDLNFAKRIIGHDSKTVSMSYLKMYIS